MADHRPNRVSVPPDVNPDDRSNRAIFDLPLSNGDHFDDASKRIEMFVFWIGAMVPSMDEDDNDDARRKLSTQRLNALLNLREARLGSQGPLVAELKDVEVAAETVRGGRAA